MPRTLKDLREVTPKTSLQNIQDDPAKNSVLGNVKKLHGMVEQFKGQNPGNDFAVNSLQEQFQRILDSFEGKEEEELGNSAIENGIFAPMDILYRTLADDNNDTKIKDEKTRKELKNLIEYVAEGLGIGEEMQISDEQRRNITIMEDQGRREVAKEQEEAEKLARKEALEAKSGLNVLDEHKAAIDALPKKFRGAGAEFDKSIANQQLKRICMDILATRRSIDAQRNDKAGLAKSKMSAELLATVKKDLVESQALSDFLDSMSYEELRSLAYAGHGGKMEEKFADYLRKNPSIHANTPPHYMPTAKQHIEALQGKMDSDFKRSTAPGEQRKLYIELLATRAAVNAQRKAKETLEPQVNPQYLEQERQKFRQEPLNTALVRLAGMDDDKRYMAYDAAKSGHGGALEDLVRRELRVMALEKESDYQMQSVDQRYAPTYAERHSDLKSLIDSGKLTAKEAFRAAVERGVLEAMSQSDNNTPDTRIGNIDSVNRQTQMQVDLYSKVMDEQSMRTFVENTKTMGYDGACSKFEAEHAGELKAINLAENLDKQLASEAPAEDVSRLAAKKMILMQRKAEFQQNKNNEALANALEDKQLNKEVDTLLEKDYNFKLMVKKLGPNRLKEQAAGDGAKLFESYSLEKADKLDEHLAKQQAPVINGPQKKEPQAGGPQLGGR